VLMRQKRDVATGSIFRNGQIVHVCCDSFGTPINGLADHRDIVKEVPNEVA
jgi:hypothetical protein